MKKYIYCILLGIMVLCTSCEDFFSTTSPSTVDAALFANPDQIELTIASVYAICGEERSYRSRLSGPWVVPGTDIEFYAPSSSSATPDYAIYTMTAAGNSDLVADKKNPWAYLTAGIERASVAVDGIERYADTTDAKVRYLYGEALTLRAWMTYEMTKFWGDIPYMFSPMGGTNEALYPKKVDRNQIYEKLREDLRHAANLMPKAEDCPKANKNIPKATVERMNREYALGLLARVDLVYAGKAMRPDQMVQGSSYKVQFNTTPEKRVELLNEVLWACEEVINDDGYGKLLNNYADVFKAVCASVTDYNQSESLWEIPFADGSRGEFMNRMAAYVNGKAIKSNLLKGIGTSGKSNAKIVATPSYIFSFEEGDARKWVTLSPGEWTYDEESKIEGVTGNVLYQSPEKVVKVYFGKYRHEWMTFVPALDQDGINVPQMRFADILLMYAEAAIGSVSEVTPSDPIRLNAQDLFNKVRARAGLDPKPLTMENLMQERAWEFGREFIRKYDLMRWGVFADKLWDAQEDIANFTHMSEGKIDFSGTPYDGKLSDAIYVKYEPTTSVTKDGSVAYRIAQIYGLQLGENSVPDGYVSSEETGGWVKSDAYTSSGNPAARITLNGHRIFGVDLTKEQLEARQYWPIFTLNSSANPNLYNDYGY